MQHQISVPTDKVVERLSEKLASTIEELVVMSLHIEALREENQRLREVIDNLTSEADASDNATKRDNGSADHKELTS